MIRVGVVGYGTIGKRVADAVAKQRDMELVGVAKVRPDYVAITAIKKGFRLYVPSSEIRNFENMGIEVAGTIEELVQSVDIVIDATPAGRGAKNRAELYDRYGVKAVFQGGEKADVADISFNALANYPKAVGKRYIRVVSCNTTAILRIVAALMLNGIELERVRVFIVRRGADPKEFTRGPINDLILDSPTIPTHHAVDVKSVVPEIDIVTAAVVAPVTLAHVHLFYATLREGVSRDAVIEALYRTPRILMFDVSKGYRSVAQIVEWARDIGRLRNDVPENIVFTDTIALNNRELFLIMAVHQEAIVVPENIDAIRAAMGIDDMWYSIRLTDESLGLFLEGKRYG